MKPFTPPGVNPSKTPQREDVQGQWWYNLDSHLGFSPIQKTADVDLHATQVMNQDAYTSFDNLENNAEV